jgi:hypothetical protein
MFENQSQIATKYFIPLSVTLSLPIFATQSENTIPSRFYNIPTIELSDETWPSFDASFFQTSLEDEITYQSIENFASKLLNESTDIPPEFAKIIDEDFWNLI